MAESFAAIAGDVRSPPSHRHRPTSHPSMRKTGARRGPRSSPASERQPHHGDTEARRKPKTVNHRVTKETRRKKAGIWTRMNADQKAKDLETQWERRKQMKSIKNALWATCMFAVRRAGPGSPACAGFCACWGGGPEARQESSPGPFRVPRSGMKDKAWVIGKDDLISELP